MTTLQARREHFGTLLYTAETGKYLHVGHDAAEEIARLVAAGRSAEALASLGLRESYDGFRWIDNPRAHPTALSAPLKVFFNLTKRCSLFCDHCYNDSGKADSPEMPTARIVEVLGDLERLGVFTLTFAGGEPTFHRGFADILDAVRASCLTVSMVTNGIALGDRMVDLIAGARRIRSVTISIDGATAEANDAVRGKGTFDRAVAGARRLRERYPHAVHLRMTLTRPALATLGAVPQLMERAGVGSLKVNRCNPYGRAAARPDLVPSQDEYEAAWDELRTLAERHRFDVEVPSRKYVVEPSGTLGLCRAGEETAEIDGDGSVYPCSFSWGRFRAGNLLSTSTDAALLELQRHSINNAFCQRCRGRGGTRHKPLGHETRLPRRRPSLPTSL
ncbi:radical SAM protein [Spirillospora sp. NPDC050679]